MITTLPATGPATGPELGEATAEALALDAVEGRVHSRELVTALDGPGTRLVTWVSGCSLRCLYCHNPDTWRIADGTLTTVGEHSVHLRRYQRFLQTAGGGITVSGGEPLMQPAFTAALLRRAKELGLHTALDTSGYLGRLATDAMLDDVDLVLLDIKASDSATYKKVTGRSLDPTLLFAERLALRGNPTWVRFVLVPGLTDEPANVRGVARIVAGLGNVERVEVLAYHALGQYKYGRLGMPYPLAGTPTPTADQMARTRQAFTDVGLLTY